MLTAARKAGSVTLPTLAAATDSLLGVIDGAPTIWDPNLVDVVEAGTAAEGLAAVRDADPLADIANTQRIDGVVTRGRYLDSAERQAVLDRVAEEAAAMSPDTVVAAGCACHGPVSPASV